MTKILYIEDEPDNVEFVTILLNDEGFEVHAKSTAADGLAAAEAWRPDVILMDVQLDKYGREMDGLEATRRLKSNPETSRIPIIMVSNFAFPDEIAQGLAAGADDYETKPFDFDKLVKKIVRLTSPAPH